MAQLRVLLETDRYDETCRFFGEHLGLPAVASWSTPARGAIFSVSGDGCVEVLESDEPAALGRTRLAAEVDDVEATHARVRAAGVTIAEPLTDQPWGHRSFSVHDPNGLPLVFFQVTGDEPVENEPG